MPTILARVVSVVESWSKLTINDTTEPLQNVWARSRFQFTIPFHPQAVDDLTDQLQKEFRSGNPDTRDLSQLTAAAYAPVGTIVSTDDLSAEVFRSPVFVASITVAHIAGSTTAEAREDFSDVTIETLSATIEVPARSKRSRPRKNVKLDRPAKHAGKRGKKK